MTKQLAKAEGLIQATVVVSAIVKANRRQIAAKIVKEGFEEKLGVELSLPMQPIHQRE